MGKKAWVASVCLAVVGVPAFGQAPAPNGAATYKAKCGSCHSIPTNKIGPAHKGVFGRKAGLAAGYSYSAPLKGSGIVWNDKTLDLWLQGPQKVVKGSKMFVAVPNAAERAAIIAYLKSPAAK
ncbi:c-type cytochrome [Sphingorhabdus sp. IMCC26285]|uniref:C-type cytochrome n=1 Tax=Sphingorhabdus profundilacus TaxID=2509718 RepID=A0A6I4LYD2_9SPHN|nr:c-type cytochrome [Sphingorhabdus profundilacus]MVZ98071.1 c-type cytochrome [Sphingorhabdus profundilacus]